MSEWACGTCTFLNADGIVCEMCRTAKPGAKGATDSGAGQWQCNICTVINQQYSPACICCGSGNPNPNERETGDIGEDFVRVFRKQASIEVLENKLQGLCTHVVFKEERGSIFGRSTDKAILEALVDLLTKPIEAPHVHVLLCRAIKNMVEVTEMVRTVLQTRCINALLVAIEQNEELANESIGLLHMICSPSMGMSAGGASGQRLLFNTGGLLKLMNFVLGQTTGESSANHNLSSDKVIVGKALIMMQQLFSLQTEEPSTEIIEALSSILHKAALSVHSREVVLQCYLKLAQTFALQKQESVLITLAGRPLLRFIVRQITVGSSSDDLSVDGIHAPLQWIAAQLVMVLGQSSAQVAEALFDSGLLKALLGVPLAAHTSETSSAPNEVHPSLRGLELCCICKHGDEHSREAVTGAALAVAEMLLKLFYQEKSDRKSSSSSRGVVTSARDQSESSRRKPGGAGKLRIGDTVIAAGSMSQVCLLSSSLCWSRVSNKDKRRGVIIDDNTDGTFLVEWTDDCITHSLGVTIAVGGGGIRGDAEQRAHRRKIHGGDMLDSFLVGHLGSLRFVEMCIADGADVNFSRDGQPVLLLAVENDSPLEVIRCLLEAGADPNKSGCLKPQSDSTAQRKQSALPSPASASASTSSSSCCGSGSGSSSGSSSESTVDDSEAMITSRTRSKTRPTKKEQDPTPAPMNKRDAAPDKHKSKTKKTKSSGKSKKNSKAKLASKVQKASHSKMEKHSTETGNPLSVASSKQRVDLVRCLLEHGADAENAGDLTQYLPEITTLISNARKSQKGEGSKTSKQTTRADHLDNKKREAELQQKCLQSVLSHRKGFSEKLLAILPNCFQLLSTNKGGTGQGGSQSESRLLALLLQLLQFYDQALLIRQVQANPMMRNAYLELFQSALTSDNLGVTILSMLVAQQFLRKVPQLSVHMRRRGIVRLFERLGSPDDVQAILQSARLHPDAPPLQAQQLTHARHIEGSSSTHSRKTTVAAIIGFITSTATTTFDLATNILTKIDPSKHFKGNESALLAAACRDLFAGNALGVRNLAKLVRASEGLTEHGFQEHLVAKCLIRFLVPDFSDNAVVWPGDRDKTKLPIPIVSSDCSRRSSKLDECSCNRTDIDPGRLMEFCQHFLSTADDSMQIEPNRNDAPPLIALLKLLQGTLTAGERLPVALHQPIGESMRSNFNCRGLLHSITEPITIRASKRSDTDLPSKKRLKSATNTGSSTGTGNSPLTIRVQPLAPLSEVSKYILRTTDWLKFHPKYLKHCCDLVGCRIEDNSQKKQELRGRQRRPKRDYPVQALVVDFDETTGIHTLVSDDEVYRWALVTRPYLIVQWRHQVPKQEFQEASLRVSRNSTKSKPSKSRKKRSVNEEQVWEWYDGQAWKEYPGHVQERLHELSETKSERSTFQIAGERHVLSFTNMTATNVESGCSRQIRCRQGSDSEDSLRRSLAIGGRDGSRCNGMLASSIEERVRALAEQGLSRGEIVQELRSGFHIDERDREEDSEDEERSSVFDSISESSSSHAPPPLRRQFSALDMSQAIRQGAVEFRRKDVAIPVDDDGSDKKEGGGRSSRKVKSSKNEKKRPPRVVIEFGVVSYQPKSRPSSLSTPLAVDSKLPGRSRVVNPSASKKSPSQRSSYPTSVAMNTRAAKAVPRRAPVMPSSKRKRKTVPDEEGAQKSHTHMDRFHPDSTVYNVLHSLLEKEELHQVDIPDRLNGKNEPGAPWSCVFELQYRIVVDENEKLRDEDDGDSNTPNSDQPPPLLTVHELEEQFRSRALTKAAFVKQLQRIGGREWLQTTPSLLPLGQARRVAASLTIQQLIEIYKQYLSRLPPTRAGKRRQGASTMLDEKSKKSKRRKRGARDVDDEASFSATCNDMHVNNDEAFGVVDTTASGLYVKIVRSGLCGPYSIESSTQFRRTDDTESSVVRPEQAASYSLTLLALLYRGLNVSENPNLDQWEANIRKVCPTSPMSPLANDKPPKDTSSEGHIDWQLLWQNTKITRKLATQLRDPLSVSSGALPAWCMPPTRISDSVPADQPSSLLCLCPFLFPLKIRRQHLESSAFSVSRAVHWLQEQVLDSVAGVTQGIVGHTSPQRGHRAAIAAGLGHGSAGAIRFGSLWHERATISRTNLLSQAQLLMKDLARSGTKAVLEVVFKHEQGTGSAITREFYTALATNLHSHAINKLVPMWVPDRFHGTIVDRSSRSWKSGMTINVRCRDVGSGSNESLFEAPIERLPDHIKKDNGQLVVTMRLMKPGNKDQSVIELKRQLQGELWLGPPEGNLRFKMRLFFCGHELGDATSLRDCKGLTNNATLQLIIFAHVKPTASTSSLASGASGSKDSRPVSISLLYPAPITAVSHTPQQIDEICERFRFMGRLMARAVMDGQLLPLPLSLPFFKLALLSQPLGVSDLDWLPRSEGVRWLVHHLCPRVQSAEDRYRKNAPQVQEEKVRAEQQLELQAISEDRSLWPSGVSVGEYLSHLRFTDPWSNMPLPPTCQRAKRKNDDRAVTVETVNEWVERVLQLWFRDGVMRQVRAFQDGWNEVFPLNALQSFTPVELSGMLCGETAVLAQTASFAAVNGGVEGGVHAMHNHAVWDAETLQRHVHPGDGFDRSSKSFVLLLREMEAMPSSERRRLLRFVTGLSALPVGGMACLKNLLGPPAPPNDGITVDLLRTDATGNPRSSEFLRKNALPRARTCTGQLRMPAYETPEELQNGLQRALDLDAFAPGFGVQ